MPCEDCQNLQVYITDLAEAMGGSAPDLVRGQDMRSALNRLVGIAQAQRKHMDEMVRQRQNG